MSNIEKKLEIAEKALYKILNSKGAGRDTMHSAASALIGIAKLGPEATQPLSAANVAGEEEPRAAKKSDPRMGFDQGPQEYAYSDEHLVAVDIRVLRGELESAFARGRVHSCFSPAVYAVQRIDAWNLPDAFGGLGAKAIEALDKARLSLQAAEEALTHEDAKRVAYAGLKHIIDLLKDA